MSRPQRPETNDPRDIADYVDARLAEYERRLSAHIDGKFNELRTLFLSGFPEGDPALHRAYHVEQIEMIRARKQFYRGLIEKSAFGVIAAMAGAMVTAMVLYIKTYLGKGP